MGRTKWYSEPESNIQPKSSKTGAGSNRTRRATMAPGRFIQDSHDGLSLAELVKLLMLRVRRNWIALCFQANRFTLGVFQRKTVLKLSFVVAAGYFLLFFEQETGFLSGKEIGGEAIETTLNISADQGIKKKGKVKHKSEAAPVNAADMNTGQADDYIERYAKIAIAEMEKFGVPASISLAQGLIESRAGRSKLATSNNNHFGIKCFSHNCRAGHCSNFTDDSHKDFFRKFNNPWESWRAHSQMISTGRYAKLKKYGHNYKNWAYGLKSVGYATDRTYAEKLIGVIERYNLNRFDRY